LKSAATLVHPVHLSASEVLRTSTLTFTLLLAASVAALGLVKGKRDIDE
jgi:hypothetical protein